MEICKKSRSAMIVTHVLRCKTTSDENQVVSNTARRSQAKISEHVSRQHNQDKNGQSSASAINQTYSGYMVK
jgi:hypothetical protein